MNRRQFHKAVAAIAATAPAQTESQTRTASGAPANIGTRRELFIDRALISEARGVELRLATPVDGGTALALDRPWEGNFGNYTTVLKDGDLLRMYYRGTPGAGDGNENEVTCCAESRDGIRWTRPELNFYEVHGQRTNNV